MNEEITWICGIIPQNTPKTKFWNSQFVTRKVTQAVNLHLHTLWDGENQDTFIYEYLILNSTIISSGGLFCKHNRCRPKQETHTWECIPLKIIKTYFSARPVVSYHMVLTVSNILLCKHTYWSQWEYLQNEERPPWKLTLKPKDSTRSHEWRQPLSPKARALFSLRDRNLEHSSVFSQGLLILLICALWALLNSFMKINLGEWAFPHRAFQVLWLRMKCSIHYTLWTQLSFWTLG